MHVNLETHQIRFRHVLGDAGKPDTLSLKRFRLSDREFRTLSRQVEMILDAQSKDLDHLASTIAWLNSIPRKLRTYLVDRLLRFDPKFGPSSNEDLDELIDLYEAYRTELPTKLTTDQAVMSDVERLRERCPRDVKSIDAGQLADLIAEYSEEQPLLSNTLARIAKNWHTFFAWLKDERRVISDNPAATLDRIITRKAKDEVKPEWVDRLVAKCKTQEDRYFLRLLQWTGCRLREGLALRVTDIDVPRKRITFTETKNSRLRVNPLYPAIAAELAGLLEGRPDGEVILQHVSGHTCYGWLAELQRDAGIEPWSPPFNAFRATRVNQLADEIPAEKAGLLLGHSLIVARRNYMSVEESLLERLST